MHSESHPLQKKHRSEAFEGLSSLAHPLMAMCTEGGKAVVQ